VDGSICLTSLFSSKMWLELCQKTIVNSTALNAVKKNSDSSCRIFLIVNMNDVHFQVIMAAIYCMFAWGVELDLLRAVNFFCTVIIMDQQGCLKTVLG